MYFNRSFQHDADDKPLYPFLEQYTAPLKRAERDIVGRELEKSRVLAAMMRPELCNVMLLAEAGSGKTALVQGLMLDDMERYYLEVDLSHMIADLMDKNQMADKLKGLFDDTQRYCEDTGIQIVLFIDEFHQIVELSPAAVEALKPLLADSGTRGIRVIAATTYVEFRKWISPNQPLVERLQRINLEPPDKKMVVAILRGMARRYGVDSQFYDDRLFEEIYDLTNRYIPANAQPRKSILVLDAMVGWYRHSRRRLDRRLLADVIYESEGVNIAFRVDATKIKEELDSHVYAQELATSIIQDRLQICVADLNDKSKPMSSFLFTGSTGTGKGLLDTERIPVWDPDGKIFEKRNGDLKIGDYVFNRKGEPTRVVGVFHRGLQDIYEVHLTDGRSIRTDGSHLWTYLQSKGKYTANTYTNSTKELFERGIYTESIDGRHNLKYWIPMNHAVQYPEAQVSVHPYVMGAFIGDGCCTLRALTFSSSDPDLVEHLSQLLGGCEGRQVGTRNFNWQFANLDRMKYGRSKWIRSAAVFSDYPEVLGKRANEKAIPAAYMHGSIEQRWELVRGLFDTDGSIGSADNGRYNVTYSTTSKVLVHQLQDLLYSLGVASTITIARETKTGDNRYVQYRLSVKSSNENKDRFFWLPRKMAVANAAKNLANSERLAKKKDYLWVGISDIIKLDEQAETTCIYVEDDEHLYQAGPYIVTHNTEMTKTLAKILFNDSRRLIRFDMTEYANESSLDLFRTELTNRVWERPYSIILLDEIEKACAPVTRVLLQVLDDGRLTDENNREVSFVNAYIVMTTNAGNEVYRGISQYDSSDTGSGENMKKYQKLIRQSISSTTGGNRFPPELLGRIDCIVPFQPLSENTQKLIVRNKLANLSEQVREKHGIELQIHQRVVDYIVKDNLDTESDSGGARAVISKLESEVVTAVARAINNYPYVQALKVNYEGVAAFEDKNRLESSAHIVITPVVTNSAGRR